MAKDRGIYNVARVDKNNPPKVPDGVEWFKYHKFADHSKGCPEPSWCPVCDGGIKICERCNLSTGCLTSECPGYDCMRAMGNWIKKGQWDFVDGLWIYGRPAPTLPGHRRYMRKKRLEEAGLKEGMRKKKWKSLKKPYHYRWIK